MTKYLSKLDTKRFGFKVARIENFRGDPNMIIGNLKKQNVKLIIARVNTDDITTINILESFGFEYKDTQLKYCLPLDKKEKEDLDSNKNFNVRPATEADIDELVTIAKEAFYNHGHYFADPKLGREKCIEIYMDWTRRCCLDKSFADIVFVAENDKEIMGFLSYKIIKEGNSKFSRTGLGAMKKKYRGEGVYSEILKHGKNWGIELNLDREEHYVLATNIPINNLFVKMGFKLFGGFITFHYWLDYKNHEKNKYIQFTWDTHFFGFKVAKIIPESISPQELGEVLQSLKQNSFRFIYLFLDPSDTDFNQSAIDNKGILVDEKITYDINLTSDYYDNSNDNIIEYVLNEKKLNEQLKNLAIQAGIYSRFRKDPNLDQDKFINLYSTWVKNSVNGIMADHIFIYKIENDIKGFITLKTKNRIGEIGLIGVDKEERGKSIGSQLINFAKSFFYNNRIFEIKVVTQKENNPACNFYEKNGFTIKKIQNVYHFWLKK